MVVNTFTLSLSFFFKFCSVCFFTSSSSFYNSLAPLSIMFVACTQESLSRKIFEERTYRLKLTHWFNDNIIHWISKGFSPSQISCPTSDATSIFLGLKILCLMSNFLMTKQEGFLVLWIGAEDRKKLKADPRRERDQIK